jgi:hypothetical protein
MGIANAAWTHTTQVDAPAASVDRPIPATNRGYRLLARLGWQAGAGLGRSGSGTPASLVPVPPVADGAGRCRVPGRTEPIPFAAKLDMLGVGKAAEDTAVLDETAARRRQLESELEETDELRQKRQVPLARGTQPHAAVERVGH